ncbi:MAG: DUF364 domain-containing protein [Deltaproteobacteria bacterium]|nr:DUF364 domain-containing protein [Deltaproteobacteria bacterium]
MQDSAHMNQTLTDILNTLSDDCKVSDVRVCQKSTIVSSKHLGIAYNFPRTLNTPGNHDPINNCGHLTESTSLELAQYSLSDNWTEASIGVAAINSMISRDPSEVHRINGKKILFELCNNKRVAMVGHFNFTDKLRKICSHLDVLELIPQPGDLPADKASEVIPEADIVIITGTTLVNHTFDKIASLAKDAYSMVLGPTTIMSPVLFDYGIDDICGVRITDPETAIRFLSQGGSFRDIVGTEQIVMSRH